MMPSVAAHDGSFFLAVCQPWIWSSAHGKSMPSSWRALKANVLTSSSRCSRTKRIVSSFLVILRRQR